MVTGGSDPSLQDSSDRLRRSEQGQARCGMGMRVKLTSSGVPATAPAAGAAEGLDRAARDGAAAARGRTESALGADGGPAERQSRAGARRGRRGWPPRCAADQRRWWSACRDARGSATARLAARVQPQQAAAEQACVQDGGMARGVRVPDGARRAGRVAPVEPKSHVRARGRRELLRDPPTVCSAFVQSGWRAADDSPRCARAPAGEAPERRLAAASKRRRGGIDARRVQRPRLAPTAL